VCRFNWHSAGSLDWPFPMLKYKYIFENKIYWSNFIKRHSEIVTVWNYQNVDCSLKNKFIVLFCMIFGTLAFPINLQWCRFWLHYLGLWLSATFHFIRPRSHAPQRCGLFLRMSWRPLVCPSVCVLVTTVSPAETTVPIERSFGVQARVRPPNRASDVDPVEEKVCSVKHSWKR